MIARAFASLPERWQAVLWHTEIEGARPADVAPLLGLTANGVAALAYRAREGLRQAYLQMRPRPGRRRLPDLGRGQGLGGRLDRGPAGLVAARAQGPAGRGGGRRGCGSRRPGRRGAGADRELRSRAGAPRPASGVPGVPGSASGASGSVITAAAPVNPSRCPVNPSRCPAVPAPLPASLIRPFPRADDTPTSRGEGCPHQVSQLSRRPLLCVIAPLIAGFFAPKDSSARRRLFGGADVTAEVTAGRQQGS